VGNPWLDAGIVSFSTMQYRINPEYWRKWYPADWVSESFPGQFRNWFYSLLAMATVIDGSAPFKELFGYATLLAEDGREMHKSWGNSIEFNEAADKMGADVMRWRYCAHKPENNLLFGYHGADDVRRRFLIPLWNVYSFFVTYANLDGWKPNLSAFDPDYPEGSSPTSDNPLDRWILARLNQVVSLVTENLLATDPFASTLTVEPFVDDLSNWYVRRSRRRFWKSEHDTDKDIAYATLYHVLVKLARLLAPFLPFVSEQMYQNLVRSFQTNGHESIHHTRWPQVDYPVIDETLIIQVDLARRVASLGLSARTNAGLKVRQPLSKVLIFVSQGKAELTDEQMEIVADELNVKEIKFVQKAGQLVTYRILPNNKLLGPRFGAAFPAVREALGELNPENVAARVAAGESLDVQVNGERLTLAAEEVLVQTLPAEGLAVAADKAVIVGIDTVITPELHAEGLARELVRRIQEMRKNAGFNIEDRITTFWQADESLAAVFRNWEVYIKNETLTTNLVNAAPPEAAYVETQKVDGEQVVLGVRQN
jgi:isoleucyl-tRNA synthetase